MTSPRAAIPWFRRPRGKLGALQEDRLSLFSADILTHRRSDIRLYLPAVVFLFLFVFVLNGGLLGGLHAAQEHSGADPAALTHLMVMVALQLAVIISAAKLMGEFFERVLKQPAVLGELAAGLIIGPYALGGMTFGNFMLFPESHAALPGIIPVDETVYAISTVASLILLFLAGLETDFKQFFRFALQGSLVGIGGVLGAFVTGDLLYAWWYNTSFMDPVALFMGTISVATSVGITARILSEKQKLDTPEGVTIIAGAVIDDVLGILVLAIVVAMATMGGGGDHGAATGGVEWGEIGKIAASAVGFWLVGTGAAIALAKPIRSVLEKFKGPGVVAGCALALALLLSGLMEAIGHLAMIIGAYSMGLGFAKEKNFAHELERALSGTASLLVPVFFCTMGMLVDFGAMRHALTFGALFSLVAIVAKVVGCGAPTLLVKFNMLGAMRVGIGMLPRGEVALIVAGVGLAQGVINHEMFGVSIMMSLVTTVIAPPLLVKLFSTTTPGVLGQAAVAKGYDVEATAVSVGQQRFMESRLLSKFVATTLHEGLLAQLRERPDASVNKIGTTHFITVGNDITFELRLLDNERLIVASSPEDQREVRELVTDGLSAIRRQFAAPEVCVDPLEFASSEGVLF
jgi:Kef-type K+ transport system membrane component KefB